MKVLGVTGPGAEAVAADLADRLDSRGTVATVTRDGSDPTDPDSLAPESTGRTDRTTVELDESGWTVRGTDRSLSEVLDGLAPDHEYAVVVGFPDARIPQVALDGASVERTLVDAPDRESLDVTGVVNALEAEEPHETLGSLVARAKRSPDAERSGAIATFTGRVRAKDRDDDTPTEHLEFETYEGIAEERMATIREELEAREGVFRVLLHHRTGVVENGEDIVFVVVLAGHRKEAFRTVEDGINRLKDEVPIFKKEVTVDEQFWVHER